MTDTQNVRRITTDINPFEGWKPMSAIASIPACMLAFIPFAFGLVMFTSALGGRHREPRPLTPVTGALAAILVVVGLAAVAATLVADHRNIKVRRRHNAQIAMNKINELGPILADAGVPLPDRFAAVNAWRVVGMYAPYAMVDRTTQRVLTYTSGDHEIILYAKYGDPFTITIAPTAPALAAAGK